MTLKLEMTSVALGLQAGCHPTSLRPTLEIIAVQEHFGDVRPSLTEFYNDVYKNGF